MSISRVLFAVLLGTSSLTACLDDGSFDETSGDLVIGQSTPPQLANWSYTGGRGNYDMSYQPSMTVLNGKELYVYPNPSDNSGPLWTLSHDLSFTQCDASGCTPMAKIPGQQSLGPASLAAFNGSVYMLHQGDSSDTAVWFSQFNPSTGYWTPNTDHITRGYNKLTTYGGSPAMAAFGSRMYIVGSYQASDGTYPLWFTSMGTDLLVDEVTMIPGGQSLSPPSLAVLDGVLYLATVEANHVIGLRTMKTPGGQWSAVSYIPAGNNGDYFLQGRDVGLAAQNGYLHIVHHKMSGGEAYWTFNRGCDQFPIEQQIPNYSYDPRVILSVGLNSTFALNKMVDNGLYPYTHNQWSEIRFHSPATPIRPPSCVGGIGH